MRSRTVYASAMYQSLRVAYCGVLAWRQCRLSISAWPIAAGSSPVRTLDGAIRFAAASGAPAIAGFIRSFLRVMAVTHERPGGARRDRRTTQGVAPHVPPRAYCCCRRSQHRPCQGVQGSYLHAGGPARRSDPPAVRRLHGMPEPQYMRGARMHPVTPVSTL